MFSNKWIKRSTCQTFGRRVTFKIRASLMGDMIAPVLFNNGCLIADVTCRRLAVSGWTNRRSMPDCQCKSWSAGCRASIHCSL